jgi:hypothetical protein
MSRALPLINTVLQRGAWQAEVDPSCFNGFHPPSLTLSQVSSRARRHWGNEARCQSAEVKQMEVTLWVPP